jgi:hypothetical protein
MRKLLLLPLLAVPAFAQLTFGVKAGVPLTDFLEVARSPNFGFNTNTKRYIVGPTVELRLPFGLGVEVDALYRRLNYEGNGTLLDVLTNNRTTGNAWEFPLLLKYRAPGPLVRPYFTVGVAWDTLSGMTQSITRTLASGQITSLISNDPAELQNKTTTGFVIGGGVDIHAIFLHVSPEIRYTRWGNQHFADPSGLLQSNRNQAEFLLGFTF